MAVNNGLLSTYFRSPHTGVMGAIYSTTLTHDLERHLNTEPWAYCYTTPLSITTRQADKHRAIQQR